MQLIIFAVLAVVVVAVLVARRRSSKWSYGLAGAGLLIAIALMFQRPPTTVIDATLAAELPHKVQEGGYASSESCRECHEKEYAAEQNSYHRKMARVATPETVLGDFDNVELESWGRTYRLERRGDEFWVELPDPDEDMKNIRKEIDPYDVTTPPMVWKQIVLATGEHYMQAYWVALEADQSLLQFPWIYLLDTKRWIPREEIFLYPDSWKKRPMPAMWNGSCIRCHGTGGKPERNDANMMFNSKVVDFGVSCEACHGPAEEHIRVNQSPLRRLRMRWTGEVDTSIVNPPNLDHKAASMVCGQCHGFFAYNSSKAYWREGDFYRPGDDLRITRDLLTPPGTAWEDGTARLAGVLEFVNLEESACYTKGQLSCTMCHNMHDSDPVDLLEPGKEGDEACLQCHESFRDNAWLHSRHKPTSEGSRCMNCHMPNSTSVLFHNARSHRIDSPTAAQSAGDGRPNGCNLCHLDQTLAWTSKWLTEWYEQPEVEMTDDEKNVANGPLWLLRGDSFQRLVLVGQLGWDPAMVAAGTDWGVPYMVHLLNDPYSMIRRVSFLSLRKMPGYADFEFNFMAPPEERERAQALAMSMWNPTADRENLAELLLDASGRVEQERFDHFAAQRNDATPAQKRRPGTSGDVEASEDYGGIGPIGH